MSHSKLQRAIAAVALAGTLAACGTISVEEEKRLGAQFQAEARKQFTFVRDPVSVNYLRQFGAQLAAAARPSPFEFRFYLIEDEEVNAFAAPGGAMYVHTGLMLAVSNSAELASVLCHEMGHVTARHVAKSVNKQRGTGFFVTVLAYAVYFLTGIPIAAQGAGMAGQIAGRAYLSSFTRDDEREADALGFETMTNAGWNPMGMVTMFETLKKEYGGSRGISFLSSHPATDERIATARAAVANYPSPDKLKLEDPKLPIIQERLKLIIGTDREKVDESDESDDGSDDEE